MIVKIIDKGIDKGRVHIECDSTTDMDFSCNIFSVAFDKRASTILSLTLSLNDAMTLMNELKERTSELLKTLPENINEGKEK